MLKLNPSINIEPTRQNNSHISFHLISYLIKNIQNGRVENALNWADQYKDTNPEIVRAIKNYADRTLANNLTISGKA